MILLRPIYKSFITISLVLLISMVTAFGFMGGNSFASTKPMSSISPLSNQIAWGDEDIETGDKNLEGKTEIQMEESQKLDSETQDSISNAIQNPSYKPNKGQIQKEERQSTKDIKAEARDAMLSN
ncbi:hypothetical protein AA637_07925 [Cyanobacterium sp. HL-69]|uniref:hypothetical protein n=1 Tax=Cyanobacterium sp. HL-69 TaxID=2054282 RepID=UPI000CA30F37|nr:hypothetical protein AA637_07925 [Cyanobacterium sp. HL-69]